MKRQLERLKGKRLVTGNPNLMTRDEICINTTSDGGVEVKEIGTDGKIKDLANSGGGSSKYAPRYFSIDWNTADEDWKYTLCADNTGFKISSISKCNISYGKVINTYGAALDSYNTILAFCFQPLYISKQIIEEMFGITDVKEHIDTIEDAISLVNKIISIVESEPYTLSMEGITEITEEEFYTL